MKPVWPGATIGMIGGGQLGRMSILAGRELGYRFCVLEPRNPCSAGMVADQHIVAEYDDVTALRKFARHADVATLEFENVPAGTLDTLSRSVAIHPGRLALEVCQNRGREKAFLRAHHIPCAPYRLVSSLQELTTAVTELGVPAVLKTADFGYDGKGQIWIDGDTDLAHAWTEYEGRSAVLEAAVNFSGEYSIICGRNGFGETCTYPLIHNVHRNNILHTSISPVDLPEPLQTSAQELAMRVADGLELIGLLAVELFLTEAGWIVNEMAPRPHNSGHLTIDAHTTSQFEQHIRLVCGLPPGETRQHSAACMLNLLGDLWQAGAPDWSDVLADPDCKLHLYDKGEPRPGRKMGHVTFVGDDEKVCLQRALACYEQLTRQIDKS